MSPKFPEMPAGTKTRKGVHRAKADGTVDVDLEGSIDAALSVGRLDVRNKKPGMDYCWVSKKRLGEAQVKSWVVCNDPDIWTPHRAGIDGSQTGSIHQTPNLVLMMRPMRISDGIRKRKDEQLRRAERGAGARVATNTSKVQSSTSLELIDDGVGAQSIEDGDDAGGEGDEM
jgi:hypothetical protein